MVHTIVLPVATTFFTARITIAAALASSPVVGSSMKMIEGFATSSTAIVSRFRCSVERPLAEVVMLNVFDELFNEHMPFQSSKLVELKTELLLKLEIRCLNDDLKLLPISDSSALIDSISSEPTS
nr:Coatomer subunit beta-1 [Ipomoea batatas]